MRTLCLTAALVLSGGVAFADPPSSELQGLQRAVLAHYEAGEAAQAQRALAAHTRAGAWADLGQVVVCATFHSRDKGLTLSVRRKPGVSGDLLVAFPPGTYGKPLARSGPTPQDLILVRAPVVALAASQQGAEVTVPVACASYRRQGPKGGVPYRLSMAAPDSNLGRLARVLCMGSKRPPDPVLALAVWVAHEDLGYERIAHSSAGFRTFLTPRQRVIPMRDAGPAARLLERAQIDPKTTSFFRSLSRLARRSGPQTGAESTPESSPRPAPKPRRATLQHPPATP